MSWNQYFQAINWLQFLPPAFSIYLLAISGFTSRNVKNRIDEFLSGKPGLKNHKLTIQFITLDWAARLNFFNSMFVAMISVFPIWINQSYYLLVATSVFILIIFIPMFWWITDHRPDELPATTFKRIGITHATFCRIVLILVNLVLITAIAYSQWLRLTTLPH